ncbi:hypothetical protein IWQ51_005787 [Labrenzia sp. EL_142]|nr:hypothetical protein [Labrenzia sp. EL_142]
MGSSSLFDIGISPTDYIPIVEIGLFLGVGLCLLTPQRTRLQFKFGRFFAMADASKTSTLLFMVAVGIHFANYFYSGMAKVLLDGGPILWVMQNPTDVLALNAYVGGFLPSTFLFAGQASGAKTLEALRPLINYSILLAQLGAIIFILRKRSMILATLFYDITHVVIYLVSGIFFWKWIILNIGLVLAMRKLPRWIETPKPMILGVAAIVLSPYAFHIARLGWYDTPALVVSEVYAVTADGKQVRVPSNFFGTVSVTVAQHRLGRTNPGHYPTVTWGTTQNAEVFDKAIKDCSYSADEVWQFKTTPNKIIRIVQYNHAYALQQVADGSTFHYNWFPHHIWSYPLSYRDFDTVALTDIDYYLYRTTSFCVHLGLNGPEIEEVTSDEFQIPLHPDAQSKTGL